MVVSFRRGYLVPSFRPNERGVRVLSESRRDVDEAGAKRESYEGIVRAIQSVCVLVGAGGEGQGGFNMAVDSRGQSAGGSCLTSINDVDVSDVPQLSVFYGVPPPRSRPSRCCSVSSSLETGTARSSTRAFTRPVGRRLNYFPRTFNLQPSSSVAVVLGIQGRAVFPRMLLAHASE
ncbi:hypothetical protein L226DRAFT_272467 [Lentinus tigrinus ALCF2SS1-7]|uniref:Uncharacterized protein n=1 Tax=Lentinus tigrinus ALCF2SS1-6 TaxID=1328759 RepID=A0A5C2SG07_9APHY|nr:hypothetical protein L227DRAFT_97526 [Lentinus tigrinus ALCF2SS1-6]RPD69559.1 hypothetical protein L226DRAFT_272467 [Lentinus tigrinus ALCF2SS1-7]